MVDQCQLLDEPQRGEGAGSRRHARRIGQPGGYRRGEHGLRRLPHEGQKRRFDRRLLRDGAQDRRPGTHLCRPQYQYRHHRSQYVALRRQYRSPLPPGVEQPVLLQGREPRRAVRCPHRRPGRFGDAGPDGSLGCLAGFGRCPGKRRCLDLRGSESPRCQGLLRQQRQRAFDAFTLRLQHDQRPPA